jgi:hypothetical protein
MSTMNQLVAAAITAERHREGERARTAQVAYDVSRPPCARRCRGTWWPLPRRRVRTVAT